MAGYTLGLSNGASLHEFWPHGHLRSKTADRTAANNSRLPTTPLCSLQIATHKTTSLRERNSRMALERCISVKNHLMSRNNF